MSQGIFNYPRRSEGWQEQSIKHLDWKKTVGILVAIGLLYASIHNVNLRELWHAVKEVNFLFILTAFISSIAMNWAKSMRWRALVRDVKDVSHVRSIALFHVTQMINLSLPALTGQAARIVLLSRQERLSKTFCATTVAMEVLFDGISLIVLVYLASFIFAFPDFIRTAEIYAAVGIGVILMLVFITWRNQRALEYFGKKKIKRRFPVFYEKLQRWTGSIISGMTSLRSSTRILEVAFYSALIWLFHVGVAVMLILAFELNVPVWAGVVIVIVNSFLLLIPLTPGNLGSFQLIVKGTLVELFRVPASEAFALSVVLHFMDVVPVFIIGICFLFTHHITFKKLREEAKVGAKETEPVA